MAASAGGIPALSETLKCLPSTFPAAVALVQHLSGGHQSFLPNVLRRDTAMRVKFAEDGERLRAGTVFVAPPDRHLLVTPEPRFALSSAEKINLVRPAADRLFMTASLALGARVLGVVFTGYGHDGAQGAAMVRQNGGTLLVQDPASAAVRSMPEAAIRLGNPDLVLPLSHIGRALVSLVVEPLGKALFGLPRTGLAMPAPVGTRAVI